MLGLGKGGRLQRGSIEKEKITGTEMGFAWSAGLSRHVLIKDRQQRVAAEQKTNKHTWRERRLAEGLRFVNRSALELFFMFVSTKGCILEEGKHTFTNAGTWSDNEEGHEDD